MDKLFSLYYRLKKALLRTKISSKEYIHYLSLKGISIGKGTHFFDPSTTTIDVQRSWMLHIGEYCKITQNVSILCHDYSRSVLRRKYGEVIGEAQKTFIGDNVFIGVNSIICMGAHIGDNVIIGAGSVVSGDIPSNSVAVGIPARVLCSLDDYYVKRKSKCIDESMVYASNFQKLSGRMPTEKEMGPFWQLFMPRDISILREKQIFTKLSGDCEEEILEAFMNTEPVFSTFDDFISQVKSNNLSL